LKSKPPTLTYQKNVSQNINKVTPPRKQMKERIDNIPYNLESESLETLQNIRAHLLKNHQQLTVDIERLDHVIMARNQDQFEFDSLANYEHVLGQALEAGEITAEEALIALERFSGNNLA